MLFMTREVFLDKLLQLPELIDTYQRGDMDFSVKAITWLKNLETSLGQLRSPLVSRASRQRARIVAAHEGVRDSILKNGRLSRRKEINATASFALAEIEQELVIQVQEIDRKFDVWRDKLAQFISVASNAEPIPLPPTEPRREWLQYVWRNWSHLEDTQAMYRYLNTVMEPGDRLHLLGELLEHSMDSSSKGSNTLTGHEQQGSSA